MRPPAPLVLALALVAGGAIGCSARETSGRGRVWTLFDLIDSAAVDGHVAAGGSLPDGLPWSFFVRHPVDGAGTPAHTYELNPLHGFLNGLPMTYVATELWANVPEIWAQPLYRAVDANGVIVDDPNVREPWVFGVGPRSLFYSPFWQVYGFQVPDGVAVTDLLDTRAVVDAANSTGGVRPLERRITSLVPASVGPPADWVENVYYDDSAAWDGVGDHRYLDLGPGRFEFDYEKVVREFPLFVFALRNDAGNLEPQLDWRNVGGDRALFSGAPSLVNTAGASGAGGAGAAAPSTAVDIEPNFGALWRIHLVEVPATAGPKADGRVVTNVKCADGSRPCFVLDSQAAIESLGATRIQATELLLAGPLLQLGDATFPSVSQLPPQPRPSE